MVGIHWNLDSDVHKKEIHDLQNIPRCYMKNIW